MPNKSVKNFVSSWLSDSIDGTRNSLWLQRHPSIANSAMCSICPKPNSFKIKQGYKSVRQHFNTQKHQDNLQSCQSDPRFKQGTKAGDLTGNANIVDGIDAMKEKEAQRLKNEEKVLRSQVRYVASAMYHNISNPFVDCQAGLLPQMFPCQITKKWDLRSTKETYFATHGLYPYFHGKIVKAMQAYPFSINFDESTVNGTTQLDVNVGHIGDDHLVARKMFTSIVMTEGTTAEELTEQIFGALEKDGVNPQMLLHPSTDGCTTMLGLINGVQAILRRTIPTLPKWGGCPGHDCSNILKSATKALDPTLTQIYPALFGCLSKHSMHKKREFERVEEWVGLAIRKVPKFLDVRFRVMERLARWMESQDRALYQYFSEMKEKIMEGTYVASETEMVVLEKYLGRYLEVRLSNCFILEVSKPVIAMIDFFESNKIRVQYRHEKMVLILHDYLAKFLKNAGMGNNNEASGRQLLKVNFRDREQHLSNKDIFIVRMAENLLEELGLTRQSEEIELWMENVRDFYEEAVEKMIKYFGEGIKSTSLRALSIINPKMWKTAPLDHCKKQFRILGEKFTNVIETGDIPQLMCEVADCKMRAVAGLDGWEWDEEHEPDEFFAYLHKMVDGEGNKTFPLLSKLGSALCTIYNSGSAAERDFSTMNNAITGQKSSTSQLLLETKLSIKDEINRLKRKCKQCKLLKSKGQKSEHCHCSSWSPPEELMDWMRGGGPSRRYKLDMEEKAKDKKDKEVLRDLLLEEDRETKKKDLKREAQKLKKRIRTEKRQMAEEQEKENQRKKKAKQGSQLFDTSDSSGTKRKAVSKAEEKRESQRKRLL